MATYDIEYPVHLTNDEANLIGFALGMLWYEQSDRERAASISIVRKLDLAVGDTE